MNVEVMLLFRFEIIRRLHGYVLGVHQDDARTRLGDEGKRGQ